MSLVGLLAMIVIAWLVSKHRRVVPWRTIAWGLGLQLTFALLVLKTDVGGVAFGALNDAVITVLDVTAKGTEFVFGAYANETFTIAINVLPTIDLARLGLRAMFGGLLASLMTASVAGLLV